MCYKLKATLLPILSNLQVLSQGRFLGRLFYPDLVTLDLYISSACGSLLLLLWPSAHSLRPKVITCLEMIAHQWVRTQQVSAWGSPFQAPRLTPWVQHYMSLQPLRVDDPFLTNPTGAAPERMPGKGVIRESRDLAPRHFKESRLGGQIHPPHELSLPLGYPISVCSWSWDCLVAPLNSFGCISLL